MPPAEIILLYAVIPVWLVAGLADWWCHRRSDIEHTAGAKESFIHILMYGEGAIALLAGLFLEINAGVFLLFIFLLIAHEFTGTWDVVYANTHRTITALEQRVHSFLEVMPYMAFAFVCALHWNQFISLFGFGSAAVFLPQWKNPPLSSTYIAIVIAAAVILDFVPYCEEFLRCLTVKFNKVKL